MFKRYAVVAVVWLAFGIACSCLLAQEAGYGGAARSFEDLVYPAPARNAHIQGVVVVRAMLDDEGNVVAVSAISGSKVLIPDCLENAKKWKFKPSPQKTAVIVYEFRIDDGACHDGSRSLFLLVHSNVASITACTPVTGE